MKMLASVVVLMTSSCTLPLTVGHSAVDGAQPQRARHRPKEWPSPYLAVPVQSVNAEPDPSARQIADAQIGAPPELIRANAVAMAILDTRLKDPQSAQITARSIERGWYRAPLEPHIRYAWDYTLMVNAKNSYGGYVGSQPWTFYFRDGNNCVAIDSYSSPFMNGTTVEDFDDTPKLAQMSLQPDERSVALATECFIRAAMDAAGASHMQSMFTWSPILATSYCPGQDTTVFAWGCEVRVTPPQLNGGEPTTSLWKFYFQRGNTLVAVEPPPPGRLQEQAPAIGFDLISTDDVWSKWP